MSNFYTQCIGFIELNLSLGSDAVCFDFLNHTIDGKLDKIPRGSQWIKFTEHQRKELNNWYVCNSGGTVRGELDTLITRTGLTAKQITKYMNNRREKEKKG